MKKIILSAFYLIHAKTVLTLGFLAYSVAQSEKDRSQIDHIQTLQKSWTKYYEIRKGGLSNL